MVESALKLYRIYCILNLVWYALLILTSITLVLFLRSGTLDLSQIPADQIQLLNGCLIFLAAYSWILFAVTLTLMKPVRTSKWWLGAFFNICVGISTCFLAPLCIPLALRWNSPTVKAYFATPPIEDASRFQL